jgi:hypothetical protein
VFIWYIFTVLVSCRYQEKPGNPVLNASVDFQGDFVDSYYNNTIKTMMGLRWAVETCPKVRKNRGRRFEAVPNETFFKGLPGLGSEPKIF